MYSIQIGERLFKLSGASLSFDAPSYFTNYFQQTGNESKVLFIDRSPDVFEKICRHLQGYAISIDNEYEFLYLYADSSYFHLQKLSSRILEEGLFVNVGGESFRIPKDAFMQQGNYPNYFSVLYDTLSTDVFLTNTALLRPPPMSPFTVGRCPELFKEILQTLQGNPIDIRSDNHRRDLINEAKYYSFFSLEQQLIKTDIRTNPYTNHEEILINFRDLKKDGLVNCSVNEADSLVQYARPYFDGCNQRDLIMQIESSEVSLLINAHDTFTSLTITGNTAKRMHDLLSTVSDDLMYVVTDYGPKLTLLIHMDNCCTYINGAEMEENWIAKIIEARKMIDRDSETHEDGMEVDQRDLPHPIPPKVIAVKLLKSQWTISVVGRSRIWANALMYDGVLDERNFIKKRGFL
ncbi:DEKNAAC103588 [Brettanomyces naardenensis]|uniref:DEKNAAC103588 n=1 Tax=Brettanomyces naardenensis TaxID=13370 RepID=A0A448YNQ6_BRENA|nr:DEKNAAC103588 [Brettanomyces naardenensis]